VGLVVGLVLAAAGAVVAVKLLQPPEDSGYAVGWTTTWDGPRAWRVVSYLSDGLLPIPNLEVHFWDTHLLPRTPKAVDSAAKLGLAMAGGALLLLAMRSWQAVLFFVIAGAGQLAFAYVKFLGGVRHHGGLFIALMAAVWIAWSNGRPEPLLGPVTSWWRWGRDWGQRLALVAFLAVHAHGGAVAGYFERKVPFAAGKAAGAALVANLKPDDLLVADCEFVAPSLAVYLPGRQFYFPVTRQWGTFVTWRGREAWDMAGIGAARRFAREQKRPVLWVTRSGPWNRAAGGPGVTFLGAFDSGGGTVADATAILEMESFELYRIEP
jgi:hypothetical protein